MEIILLEWWNLIFILPFLGGLFYLIMMMMGLVGEHDHDVDVSGGMDHEIDIGHDVHIGHDVGMDHDHDIDSGQHIGEHGAGEHDTEASHEAGIVIQVLSFFGLGKVPISILIMCFCFIWGVTGWSINQFLLEGGLNPTYFWWASVAGAFLTTTFFTRWFALALSRLMPTTETYGVSHASLVGKRAKAKFDISKSFGLASLYDHEGTLHDVACRVREGEPVIQRGTTVVLAQYIPEKNYFYVKEDPLGGEQQ